MPEYLVQTGPHSPTAPRLSPTVKSACEILTDLHNSAGGGVGFTQHSTLHSVTTADNSQRPLLICPLPTQSIVADTPTFCFSDVSMWWSSLVMDITSTLCFSYVSLKLTLLVSSFSISPTICVMRPSRCGRG